MLNELLSDAPRKPLQMVSVAVVDADGNKRWLGRQDTPVEDGLWTRDENSAGYGSIGALRGLNFEFIFEQAPGCNIVIALATDAQLGYTVAPDFKPDPDEVD